MSISSIEWTDQTWNPIVGCSLKSPGCTNCYAMGMAARIEAMNAAARPGHETAPHYAGTTKKVNGHAVWTGKIAFASDEVLLAPLRRKKPTVYFVNSMGDLFHEDCPDEWIDRVFAVMALCPQHTFQVLTKRAGRMREYVTGAGLPLSPRHYESATSVRDDRIWRAQFDLSPTSGHAFRDWPLPNIWLGVSAERQQEWDERKEHLCATPAAVRFASFEPLLGNIIEPRPMSDFIQWAIVGGESGPNARPMHPDWVRGLRDQCAPADVKFFFKQWGSFYPMIDRDVDDPDWRRDYSCAKRQPTRFAILNLAGGCGFHGDRVHLMQRYSKKSTGKLLDGIAHQAMPEIRRPAP